MRTTVAAMLISVALTSCGSPGAVDTSAPKGTAAPAGKGTYSLAGDQEWSRPASWRQMVSGSPDGVFVAAVATDRYGTRVVVPQPGGMDMWQAQLDCRSMRLDYRQAIVIRDGVPARTAARTPPTLDKREIGRMCSGRTPSLGDGTPEEAVARIGRLPFARMQERP